MNQPARRQPANSPTSLAPTTPFSEPWLSNLRRAMGMVSGRPALMTGFTISQDQARTISDRYSTFRQQISGGAQDRQAIGIELAKLLAAFPAQAQSDTPAALRIEAYSDAIGSSPEWAVGEARLRFVRGEVAGHDGRFAPTPAQFAAEVRSLMEPLRRDLHDLEQLAAMGVVETKAPTPDSRARVAALAAEFTASRGGRTAHQVYEDAMSGLQAKAEAAGIDLSDIPDANPGNGTFNKLSGAGAA